ncbi:MAG: hypothetical protein IK066_01620 [Kiritimatiellae bacterium]|nr:hypothetical protein [Kiritimatiellia bacterium]
MKPLEILSALPRAASATPAQILDSPAFAMPCRYGEDPAVLRSAAVRPADTLSLSLLFGDEPHVLSLGRSPRFPELDALWDTRADVPEPILLALAEKECGPLFQLLENAVRQQLRLAGMADPADPVPAALALEVADISFTLTRTPTVEAALGASLRQLDLAHPDIRSIPLSAETEFAAFALPDDDLASLAPGDALLLPEIGTIPPRLLVDSRFVLDGSSVTPFTDDSRCRVVAAEPLTITLGTLFDAADGTAPADIPPAPADSAPLRLVLSNRPLATGRLSTLGTHPAFLVESLAQ